MKIYLRDDLRYDYKKISLIYKTIIAILIAIFIVLAIVVSNNDQALKNNLILEVSKSDSEVDANEDENIQNLKDSGYKKTLNDIIYYYKCPIYNERIGKYVALFFAERSFI